MLDDYSTHAALVLFGSPRQIAFAAGLIVLLSKDDRLLRPSSAAGVFRPVGFLYSLGPPPGPTPPNLAEKTGRCAMACILLRWRKNSAGV